MADDKLSIATDQDIETLMSWFPDEQSIRLWGGPRFRYPFSLTTFLEDLRWQTELSFALRNESRDLLAFGQLYERHRRINLARVAVSPARRGSGLGRTLVAALLAEGRRRFRLNEYSLYVYRSNKDALACYRAMGFAIAEAPVDDVLMAECLYMTRAVDEMSAPSAA